MHKKFEIGDRIYWLADDTILTDIIIGYFQVDGLSETFHKFGPPRTIYATRSGQKNEEDVFLSKKELMDSLPDGHYVKSDESDEVHNHLQPKFSIGDYICYMIDNRPHSAKVLSRMIVENLHNDWGITDHQRKVFLPFGKARIVYNTCHGEIPEEQAFATKSELYKSKFGTNYDIETDAEHINTTMALVDKIVYACDPELEADYIKELCDYYKKYEDAN